MREYRIVSDGTATSTRNSVVADDAHCRGCTVHYREQGPYDETPGSIHWWSKIGRTVSVVAVALWCFLVRNLDLRSFFDTLDHDLLLRAVRHHTKEKWVVLYIERWLKAPVVLSNGEVEERERGTPQGGGRKSAACQSVPALCVRCLDGTTFSEHSVRALCRRYRLPLPQQTASTQRRQGRPGTFDFLGFTHYCTTTRRGQFQLGRKPMSKRVSRTLKRIAGVLRRRWHDDIWVVGRWLGRVVNGWLNYYAVPGSGRFIRGFARSLLRLWHRALRRRSQRDRFAWKKIERMKELLWPPVTIRHPWPNRRFAVTHPR